MRSSIIILFFSALISQTLASISLPLTPNHPPFLLSSLITPHELLQQLEALPSAIINPATDKRAIRDNRVVHLSSINKDDKCNKDSWSIEATVGTVKTRIEIDLTIEKSQKKETLSILQRSEATKWHHGITHENIEDVKEGCVKGSTKLTLAAGPKEMDLRVLKCTANLASFEAVLSSCIRSTTMDLLGLYNQHSKGETTSNLFSILFFGQRPAGVLTLSGTILSSRREDYTWISTSHLPSPLTDGVPVMTLEVKVTRYTKLVEHRPSILLPAYPFIYISSGFDLERIYSAVTGAVRLSELYPEYMEVEEQGWDVWGVPCWENGGMVSIKIGGGWKDVDPRGPRVAKGSGVCLGVFVGRRGGYGGGNQWVLGWPAMRGSEWVFDVSSLFLVDLGAGICWTTANTFHFQVDTGEVGFMRNQDFVATEMSGKREEL